MENTSGTLLDIRGILSRITGIPSAEYSQKPELEDKQYLNDKEENQND
jgi:hypothetical protein